MAILGYSHSGSKTNSNPFLLPGSDITKGGQGWWLRRCACNLRLWARSFTPAYFYLFVVGGYGYFYLIVVGNYGYKTKSSQHKLKRMQKGKL